MGIDTTLKGRQPTFQWGACTRERLSHFSTRATEFRLSPRGQGHGCGRTTLFPLLEAYVKGGKTSGGFAVCFETSCGSTARPLPCRGTRDARARGAEGRNARHHLRWWRLTRRCAALPRAPLPHEAAEDTRGSQALSLVQLSSKMLAEKERCMAVRTPSLRTLCDRRRGFTRQQLPMSGVPLLLNRG